MTVFPVLNIFTFCNKLIYAVTGHCLYLPVLNNAHCIRCSLGCVWVSLLSPSHSAAATTASLLLAILHTHMTQEARSESLAFTLVVQISWICFSCVKCFREICLKLFPHICLNYFSLGLSVSTTC
jgi:hypothetical protein